MIHQKSPCSLQTRFNADRLEIILSLFSLSRGSVLSKNSEMDPGGRVWCIIEGNQNSNWGKQTWSGGSKWDIKNKYHFSWRKKLEELSFWCYSIRSEVETGWNGCYDFLYLHEKSTILYSYYNYDLLQQI
jgi:hypothetical protein